ncbi:MAG: DNA repair protein RadA [Nitrospina sp.]|jgi:DNA repair protein RadA/Sms|nr:DNA repair protein RadA [Nitrospina sp.]MBT6600468.1 DNA repair protein RadA [Nitrospina sp.]
MAKTITEYVCQSCGHRAPKWLGKCPECEGWNTLAEEKIKAAKINRKSGNGAINSKSVQPVTSVQALTQNRLITGIGEFDRTLGGGLVEGSLVLIGGDPGIGKSTLLLQSMGEMAKSGAKVLYVSGEESPAQIKLRADRLGALSENLLVCSEICIEDVLRIVDQVKPDALVLDSIQTFFTADLQSAPGSIGQVREVAFKIFQDVKKRAMPALLIGHITKDGAIAGPKSLEHIVDTVIYFEGEKGHSYRILRAIKNRFGSTPEIGVFEMLPKGLVGVENPSDIFLSERPADSPGSIIVSSMEGTRTLLVEVQALVTSSSSIGMPRRMSAGFDHHRTSLLVAIMEKRLGLNLQGEDIFINIAGGLKISEPAVDMGVAAAIAGSFRNRSVDPHTVMIGEVGLTGEVRSVMQLEARLTEAERLGFKKCIVPHSIKGDRLINKNSALRLVPVKTLSDAFDAVF